MLDTMGSNKSRIGDVVEYKAIVWLLGQGLEVFKNVSRVGLIDIICLDKKTGIVNRIDVKKVADGSRKTTRISQPSRTADQQLLGVNLLYYDEKHDYFAWTIADIYVNMGKTQLVRDVAPQVVFNQTFPSLTATTRHYNVSDRTVREWMRRHPNNTLEQAITYALDNVKVVVVNGNQYDNKKQACEKLGVSQRTVEYWHYDKGLTIEEAINEAVRRKTNKKII